MIAGMVQGYLNPSLGEIFQELLCRLGIYSEFTEFTWILLEYVEYFEFFIYFYQSLNIYSPWPYPAKSIVRQLTQRISSMFIQAFTDYWGVKASGQLGHMSWIHEFSNFVNFSPYCWTVIESYIIWAIFTDWDSFQ